MSVKIGGTYMDRSLNEFTRACEVYIEAEQAKLAPDNALIALLCDAVRLTREMTLRGRALCATRCQCRGPPRPTDRREDLAVPLYRCENPSCGAYDNTGLTDYWTRKSLGLPALCSACSPGLAWHGRWAKASAVGMLVDGRGFLWRPQELMMIPELEIVGIVQEGA